MTAQYTGVLVRPTDLSTFPEARRTRFMKMLVHSIASALLENQVNHSDIEQHDNLLLIRTDRIDLTCETLTHVFGVKTISAVRPSAPGESGTIEVEGVSYIEEKRDEGLGGLPSGLEGRVVIMISSGLDSPVAAYKTLRRGCVPVFVHFDNSPYSDQSNRRIAIEQAKTLSKFIHGVEVKMYIVPHGDDLTEVVRHAPRKMTCIFCRRNMYRLAREVALRENAEAIITGEIIGEQASQTTRNLFVESNVICDIPVIRPCIGDDKVDIEHFSRVIGTYKYASEASSCCTLPPKYPSIRARIEEIAPAEEKMDLRWITAEVNEAEIIILKEVRASG
ncbi:MAG: hypothetical protein K9W43_03755 [Candidatus Thorarchaeota archaeon]|nr:hypothetical protein [Candidatus Thorarchaeota archaeon]